ncbi:MAG: acyl-CoA dehydrogenase family protein [Rhodospirillales bacterium]|jgi:3-hydroxy-9,10-secoandrosta-1,3,5(10)-triene-9,17-dione monooxygenase
MADGAIENLDQKTRPSRAEMLERAEALVPALKDRALETEQLGKVHPDTIKALHNTGLFRINQPARVGGGDYDYRLLMEVTSILGKGCGSTAWVYINLACHHWMLGMWPAKAQDELWDENIDVLIASSVIYPTGRATKVKGGYQLSGRWPFCSGVDWSDYVMLGGTVYDDKDEILDRRVFIVSKQDLTVHDNWDVSGLCGTGSKDSEAKDVFIPEHMTLAGHDMQNCKTPGSGVNPAPLFNLPQAALFPHIIAAPIIGMAEGAYDHFVDANKVAKSTYNTSRIAEYQAIQTKAATAAAAVEVAKTMINANCDEATATLTRGDICSEEQKHRWRRDAAYAANLCFDAIEGLYKATGGRGAYKSNPIQRHYRDASVGITHISMSWDVMGAEYGRYVLGLGGNPSI